MKYEPEINEVTISILKMIEYLNNIVESIDKVNTNELKLKDFKSEKLFKLFLNK